MNQEQVDATMRSVPAVRRRSPFYALSFPNFRLFFIGQIISVAGTWMQTVAQGWLVWRLTGSSVWLGWVSGASALPFVVFSLWGGHIADRYSRRNILIGTQTAAMVLAFVLAYLARMHIVAAWHILVLAMLSSIINAFNMPAQQAFVTDMVDERDALSNAIALNSLRFNLARCVGPVLAGIVLVKWDSATCFFLNGLSFIAVIISLYMMKLPPFEQIARSVSAWDGFSHIRQNRSMFRVILLIGFGAFLAWPVSTLYPVLADMYKVGAKGYSGMMSANGVGAALGGFSLAALGHILKRRMVVYGGSALFCVALLALSATANYRVALAILVISGFAMILFGISSQTKVQEEAPDHLRGRVMAVYSLVFNGTFPLGGLLIGYMASPRHLGVVNAIRVNAVLSLVVTGILYLWSQRDRPAETPQAGG